MAFMVLMGINAGECGGCLCLCHSVSLSSLSLCPLCLSVRLSACPPVRLSACPSVGLSVCLCEYR